MASNALARTPVRVPPRHAAQSRLLTIYLDRSYPPEMLVIDARHHLALYAVQTSLETDDEPDIRLERLDYPAPPDYTDPPAAEKVFIGDAYFDKPSGTIVLRNGSYWFTLHSAGRLNRSFEFESRMGPLRWEREGRFGKGLQLLDAEKRSIARFMDAELVPGHGLKVQIMDGEAIERAWLEEILLSSIAVIEWKRRIGSVGGLSMIDAKRTTRKVMSAVAGFSKTAGQFLKMATGRKTRRQVNF
ncbi:hypothetical protein MMC07_001720 [Pseudocyphellaria aurata]|nr:hypothetical protein [Pseudocyphellaria aurata]